MWQTICLCLPTMPESERLRFLNLYGQFAHPHQEFNEVDLGLAFLSHLTPAEALTVLQERQNLIERSQEWLSTHAQQSHGGGLLNLLIQDHTYTLLEAEHRWLEGAVRRLRSSATMELNSR
ncbi:hypothetical protein [Ktedonobacter racemifer]|uniref:PadR family transcriptional regulator n=1 Tax=Ktedonobacter racemifer DSM 44963 TaxID=485913 RepID=D6TTX0_KTERA|nr:hypothetical protein [Ktedonobacter racemifer]EFH83871.1 PadR family transcriptional regulator [Ktedonobacter racemifer DSM 44963]